MKTEQIIILVVAFFLGMLLLNMVKNVCGCGVVEGQFSLNDNIPDGGRTILDVIGVDGNMPSCLTSIGTYCNQSISDVCNWEDGTGYCDPDGSYLTFQHLIDARGPRGSAGPWSETCGTAEEFITQMKSINGLCPAAGGGGGPPTPPPAGGDDGRRPAAGGYDGPPTPLPGGSGPSRDGPPPLTCDHRDIQVMRAALDGSTTTRLVLEDYLSLIDSMRTAVNINLFGGEGLPCIADPSEKHKVSFECQPDGEGGGVFSYTIPPECVQEDTPPAPPPPGASGVEVNEWVPYVTSEDNEYLDSVLDSYLAGLNQTGSPLVCPTPAVNDRGLKIPGCDFPIRLQSRPTAAGRREYVYGGDSDCSSPLSIDTLAQIDPTFQSAFSAAELGAGTPGPSADLLQGLFCMPNPAYQGTAPTCPGRS